MPLFANLLGFFLLAAVPTVTVIYLLRRRYKRFDVPSLMFWDFPDQIRDGGRALNPEKLPPIFWLELLIVILCALAAATPYLTGKTHKQTLAIVVDGSASMSAKSLRVAESANQSGTAAGAWQSLRDEAKNPAWRDVVVIRAATNPERLDLDDTLKNGWDVSGATADISSAIDMARAQIPADGHILVLSDAAPQNTTDAATVEWRAFGQPLENIAIVNGVCARNPDNTSSCMIEVARFGGAQTGVDVTIEIAGNTTTRTLTFNENGTAMLLFDIPENTGVVAVSLPDDALAADNIAHLVALPRGVVDVRLDFADASLGEIVSRALTATGRANFSDSTNAVLMTDRTPAHDANRYMRFHAVTNATRFAGPFLKSESDRLMDGLDFRDSVWMADASARFPGMPVLLAGDTHLVSVTRAQDNIGVNIQYTRAGSTVQQTPDWPILFWNFLDECYENIPPGLTHTLYRLGDVIKILTRDEHVDIGFVNQSGSAASATRTPVQAHSGAAVFRPDAYGVYAVKDSDTEILLAVNFMNAAESDLRDRATLVRKRNVSAGEVSQSVYYRNIAWLFLLAALAGMLWHLRLVSRR